jgi:hypothetical protein
VKPHRRGPKVAGRPAGGFGADSRGIGGPGAGMGETPQAAARPASALPCPYSNYYSTEGGLGVR